MTSLSLGFCKLAILIFRSRRQKGTCWNFCVQTGSGQRVECKPKAEARKNTHRLKSRLPRMEPGKWGFISRAAERVMCSECASPLCPRSWPPFMSWEDWLASHSFHRTLTCSQWQICLHSGTLACPHSYRCSVDRSTGRRPTSPQASPIRHCLASDICHLFNPCSIAEM